VSTGRIEQKYSSRNKPHRKYSPFSLREYFRSPYNFLQSLQLHTLSLQNQQQQEPREEQQEQRHKPKWPGDGLSAFHRVHSRDTALQHLLSAQPSHYQTAR
jgi:hypothetical protein